MRDTSKDCVNSFDSAATFMFDKVVQTYPMDQDSAQWRNMLLKLHRALLILLQHELPKSKVIMEEYSLLHSATRLLAMEQCFDVIYSIIHTLIRYGCPNYVHVHGLTPADMALRHEERFEHDHPEFNVILELLGGPLEPLSLQELAARCVLQHRISYSRATVPPIVFSFLGPQHIQQC